VEMHTAPEESSPILPLLRDDYTYKPMCHMSTHAHHDMVHTQVHKTIRLHICLLHICMRMRQQQMSRYHIFSIVISSTSPQTVQTIVLADSQGDECCCSPVPFCRTGFALLVDSLSKVYSV
jgi:hypothetical protein